MSTPVDPPGRTAAILAALWLLTFASTSQLLIIAPLLPAISRELSVPEAQGGWLIGAYGGVACLVALIVGPISDRVGRRAVLVAGSLAMALALWAHLLASSFAALLFARAAAGAAGGVLAGASVAYVGDYFPYERRGWANGWVMSGLALGQVVGIPFGTVCAKRFGFHAPFLGLAVLISLAFVLVLAAVPQPDVPRSASVGLRRALAGYTGLLRRRATAAMASSYALTFLGMAAFVSMLPTWLHDLYGTDEDDIALLFAGGGAAAVLTNPIAGRLSDRFGRKIFIVGSCVLFGVVALLAPWAGGDSRAVMALFVVGMMAGAARTPAHQALVSALVPPEERGVMLSLGSALGQGGFALGGVVAGLLYVRTGFAGCASVTAVSMLATAVVVGGAVPEPRSSGITHP